MKPRVSKNRGKYLRRIYGRFWWGEYCQKIVFSSTFASEAAPAPDGVGTAVGDAAGDGDTTFVRSGVCDEKWMRMQRARGVRLDVTSGANARE